MINEIIMHVCCRLNLRCNLTCYPFLKLNRLLPRGALHAAVILCVRLIENAKTSILCSSAG